MFLGARTSDPAVWTVTQDIRSEGHRVVTLHCQRKDNSFVQRYNRMGQVSPGGLVNVYLGWPDRLTGSSKSRRYASLKTRVT